MTQYTGAGELSHKSRSSKSQRLMRLLGSVLNPRAWAHALRIFMLRLLQNANVFVGYDAEVV